jgi:archaellum component FlaC
MKLITLAYLSFFLMLGLSANFAVGQEKSFDASELKSIRNVSQAILKVRGQQKSQILEETQPLREEIDELRSLLQQAAGHEVASMTVNYNNEPIQAQPLVIHKPTIWGRMQRAWSSQIWKRNSGKAAERNESVEINARPNSVAKLERAKEIIENRKSSIDKELPKFWQFSKPKDEKNVRIHEALSRLESEIDAIEGEVGLARQEKLKSLIKRLDANSGAQEGLSPAVPEPTITSITKHYRK